MLRRGQKFTLDGVRFKVERVSVSRAYCVGESKTSITLTSKTGEKHTFTRRRYVELSISADTPLDLLAEFESGQRPPLFPLARS